MLVKLSNGSLIDTKAIASVEMFECIRGNYHLSVILLNGDSFVLSHEYEWRAYGELNKIHSAERNGHE